MLQLLLNQSTRSPLKVLCLGAHSDDIEIGCGGTLMKLAASYKKAHFYWVVFSAVEKERRREAIRSANLFLKQAFKKTIVVKSFKTSFFPYCGEAIKEYFEELKATFQPDLIFTHHRQDLHQDHRVLCDLSWNTWRNHLILEYEIPKYDGDLGIPNFFVHLNESLCKKKAAYLLKCFQTQGNKHWFSADTFQALLRLRGIESASPEKYAEAFHARKLVFHPT
jgi:LmbE family N-acetylglucosaminyl deacetylase